MTETSSGAGESSTTDRVRGAGSHVAGVAADEAANVKHEVGSQAKNLVGEVRSQLKGQVSTQQERAAGGIRTVSDQLRSMADSTDSGMASNLVSQAASRAGDVAGWLENREPADLLDEVKRFARRRPGLFIAIAAGTGIVVGRLAKSLAGGNDSSDSDYSTNRQSFSSPTDTTSGYADTTGYAGTSGYAGTTDADRSVYTPPVGTVDYETSGDLR
ncbi:hypothetical protein D9V29_10270 [Mycetocola manganoxydans]|uniref:DUF3618 domain-containing protein n=1 Tax=Mycetocola manganoxydans TaxID=699879 RepID=A0A3L6ZRC0_9MICO|nr:hypothetical protein [Mycetocola manganoxydans]RLP70329.1 hypothetical protein D9V29_10270 [Mycetocola manganoxydans]GHD49138.1 hypothetical protein GCM10008097_21630 [Mycetocola manganoxydans]